MRTSRRDWEAAQQLLLHSLAQQHGGRQRPGNPVLLPGPEDLDVDTVRALLAASVVVQRHLLDLACLPSSGRCRDAVVEELAALVAASAPVAGGDRLEQAVAPPVSGGVPDPVPSQGPWVYRFRDCVIDVWQRRAVVGGKQAVISRAGWSFLLILLTERDRVVSADELKSATWGELPVSASAVSTVIHALRRRLGDTGGNQTIIRTVYGRGFRFVAELAPPADDDARPAQWSAAGSPAAALSSASAGAHG